MVKSISVNLFRLEFQLMRKVYQQPHSSAIQFRPEAHLMETSRIPIGGTTDSFDSNRREQPSIWTEWDEEEE